MTSETLAFWFKSGEFRAFSCWGFLNSDLPHDRSDQNESGQEGPGLPSGSGARRRASDRSDSRRSGAGRDRNATGFPALLALPSKNGCTEKVLRANVIHGLWDPKTKLAIHCVDPSGGVE